MATEPGARVRPRPLPRMAAVTQLWPSSRMAVLASRSSRAPLFSPRAAVRSKGEVVMHWFLVQTLWFSLAALTIFVDRSLVSRPIDLENLEDVDLKDRSATPFLL